MSADEGLQRYQFMEPLGSGTQGHTFRAIDRRSGDEVAIKVVQLRGMRDWKAFDLFEREAAVLEQLRHPGIPRFRDRFASEESGDFFLVMDLVEGRSLSELLRTPGAFDEARLRRIIDGLLDILEYLHSRTPPVIHRDIKPANILVGAGDRVHLVDFGGVRVALRPDGGSTMIGTFGYMAPEQLRGDAGPGVDLYALGATITALSTGQSADELPSAGLSIDLEALTLPPALRPVLAALLEPDPRDRPTTVAEVRRLLAKPAAAASTAATDAPGVHQAPPPPSAKSRVPARRDDDDDDVPEIVREFADTPRPLSLLVWLVAGFGTLALLVFERLALPLVYTVLRALSDGDRKARKESRAELRENQHEIRRMRRLAQHVVRGTAPGSQRRRALPPRSRRSR